MKVVVIYEENHGMLGLALDYPNAINFLIEKGWLTSTEEIIENYKWFTIAEVFGENWKDKLKELDIEKFNQYFEGCFRLEEMEVYN